jgi:hypothetical protein
MITKQCQFSGVGSTGPLVQLLHPGYDNEHLVKTAAASPPQIQQIRAFVKRMPRNNGVLSVLVSALGAGEYWGSNSNGDYFGVVRSRCCMSRRDGLTCRTSSRSLSARGGSGATRRSTTPMLSSTTASPQELR